MQMYGQFERFSSKVDKKTVRQIWVGHILTLQAGANISKKLDPI